MYNHLLILIYKQTNRINSYKLKITNSFFYYLNYFDQIWLHEIILKYLNFNPVISHYINCKNFTHLLKNLIFYKKYFHFESSFNFNNKKLIDIVYLGQWKHKILYYDNELKQYKIKSQFLDKIFICRFPIITCDCFILNGTPKINNKYYLFDLNSINNIVLSYKYCNFCENPIKTSECYYIYKKYGYII